MSIKLLVTGDLHLGKHSSALPDNDTAGSTKQTWSKLTDYAVENQIDVVCLTGDIIDKDNKYYEASGPFQEGLRKLDEHGIAVYMVSGNHDWNVLPQLVKEEAYNDVHLLGRDGIWEGKDYLKGAERIRFVGWSFPTNYVETSPVFGFDRNLTATDAPCIALLHADTLSPDSRYAPVSLYELIHTDGVDVWCLGHIHDKRLFNNEKPFVFYPGSPHALSPKEQGSKGFYVLTVEGHDIRSNYIPFSPVYYDTLDIDISGITQQNEFREKVLSDIVSRTRMVNEQTEPVYIVFDIRISGECHDIVLPERWSGEIPRILDSDSRQIRTIRNIEFDLQPLLQLESWIDEPGYIGLVANALLALQRNEANEMADKLIEEWKAIWLQMAKSSAFLPLAKTDLPEGWEKEARQFVAQACKRLISELIKQKEYAD